MHTKRALMTAVIALTGATAATTATAADWSDTYLGVRYGTKFAEPFNNQDITKTILNLNHVSGYKYGTNFFNVDFLMSDSKDPGGAGASAGAQETYVVYRHTLEYGKLFGSPIKSPGILRDVGLTAGFDWNSKTDAGYNSKKRMFVLGPTAMMDVPGFLNIGLLGLWESNAPYSTFTNTATPRYSYKFHPALSLSWGIPLGGTGLSFEGFAMFIASKGKNEFGGDTAAETNIDMQVMYDVGSPLGWGKGKFKVGLEYQYWRNKFGNDHNGAAGTGAFAKTPMIRAQYHF